MVSSALSVFLLIHLTFLAWSFTFTDRPSLRLWFLRVMLFGMAYDNLILALGNIGVGMDWYIAANYPRYILHAAVLPFLTLFSLSAMQICEVPLARKQGFIQFCWAFTAVAWMYGVWHEVLLQELVPVEVMDHLRLVSASKMPPLATIATNILILPMAFMLWRRTGWYLFFAGTLFIFLLNGSTGSQPWGFIAGNGAEVIFICCLLITERFLIRTGEPGASQAQD
jgi:hypothetical protein